MALVILFLCANMDAQVVATAKGAADYVAKYISKYGAGQSVNARIASLIDDIITRLPEEKKSTIASVMSKAFIATAVPDTLCGLEAWHLLLGLSRTVCSRGFIALQGDCEKAHRSVVIPKEPVQQDAVVVSDAAGNEGTETAEILERTLVRKTPAERYCDRFSGFLLGARVTVEWLESISLATYQAEVEDRGNTLTRRRKPKVVKVKPYLNLDMSSLQAARMARMALRLHRPFENIDEDPGGLDPGGNFNLSDEEAIQQLEEFVRSATCPRWLTARYDIHNRALRRKRKHGEDGDQVEAIGADVDAPGASCAAPAAAPGSADGVAALAEGGSESGGDDAFSLQRASDVAGAHGLRWQSEGTFPEQPYSVVDAIGRASKQQIPVAYLKAFLEALRPGARVPKGRQARIAMVARCILQLDLEAFAPYRRGVAKDSLSGSALKRAAEVWRQYHPQAKKEHLQGLSQQTPYAVLWQNLKRRVLCECGLVVATAASRRIYFEAPHDRPGLAPAEHVSVKEGKWRELVRVPAPFQRDASDDALAEEQSRAREYVRSAAYEQAMGRGGAPEEEVPAALDEQALDCPDAVTKAEWDALWPYEDLIHPTAIAPTDPDLPLIPHGDERLSWVLPERDGGLPTKAFDALAKQHAEHAAAVSGTASKEAIPSLEELDPTQRAFTELGLAWHKGERRHFRALLLGTAGSGKTTTLKSLLKALRAQGLRRVAVGAYTGVAASNIGLGARTLTDLFRLAKVNNTSGDLSPLEGEDLKEFVEDLGDLELLIIDEISMVSRVMMAHIHARLREWRIAQMRYDRAEEYFGGIAVILAGDFGQLPPIAISPSLSLLNSNVVRDAREQKAANHGLRLFQAFDTVVRLRRIHRQPGASMYKESLIRTRDGAMTKEDHALWKTHDLGDPETCTLTSEERAYFEDKAPHLFAENALAGQRNGHKLGQHTAAVSGAVLRVASQDSTAAASRQAHEHYSNLRRVVHLARAAPVMLISNVRTSVGLVNGAMGSVVAVVLQGSSSSLDEGEDLRNAVTAGHVHYVIVDFPKYTGPTFFDGHPTYVPIRPLQVRHRRMKQWTRLQLPLALAWGITIHKSQGLTLPDGDTVDFSHQPTYQPVAKVGLPYVGMSRSPGFEKQAFRNVPSFWEFRKVLDDPLFKWRAAFEVRMDAVHDATLTELKGREWTLDDDLQAHVDWSERAQQKTLTATELADLHTMLAVRGVLPAPVYDDEPTRGPAGLRGGGGRKRTAGMQPPTDAKRRRVSAVVNDDQEHAEPPADEAARGCLPDPPPAAGRTMTREMAGRSASGWFCALLHRHIGAAVARPPWYMAGDAQAVRAGGVQVAATCGLHAVNHALHTLSGFAPHTWAAFDGRARDDERMPSGDWEYSALQRNVEAAGARLEPVLVESHETLATWIAEDATPHVSLWMPGHIGCIMHTPGHWVALTPPDGPQTPQCAALLSDSLRPRPYALSVEELGVQ
jgi:hypothetical protein